MNKLIRDNKVGVLISSGYGAGFSTWGAPIECIFDPDLILLIESSKFKKAIEYLNSKWPSNNFNLSVGDLEVVWVPLGSKFFIMEYDGLESIVFYEDIKWIEV